MRKIVIDAGAFEPYCGNNMRPWEMLIYQLLEVLTFSNALLLQCRGRSIPWLYEASSKLGVRYMREPEGIELFNGILAVLRNGGGDCDDLVAWRCAELRVRGSPYYPNGESARLHLIKFEKPRLTYHVQVKRQPTPEHPEGWIEDPSVVLGMPFDPKTLKNAIVVPPPSAIASLAMAA